MSDFTQSHISQVAEVILDTLVPEAPDVNKHKFFSGKKKSCLYGRLNLFL